MRPLTYIPRYTVQDYRLWEGDWELIDGLPFSLKPSPNMKHQRVSMALLTHINKALSVHKDWIIIPGVDWIINDTNILRPDLALICEKEGDFITQPPVLIVEILSDSTAHKDRLIKFEIYQEQGVKYYIIADPVSKTFQTYQLAGGKYQETHISSFIIHEGCAFDIDLAKLTAEI